MRTSLALAVLALALAACGDQAPAPATDPRPDTFVFDSGGAYHIQGFGAWVATTTRAGTFEVTHQTGDELNAYAPKPLAEADRDALWTAIDAAGLEHLDVADRPGVPDEVIYTFTLKRANQTLARHAIWKNDLPSHPALAPLIDLVRVLIEKQHGVKPVF